MEKTLTVFTIFLAAAAIGLLVGLIVVANQSDNELDGYCLTEVCVQEASRVIDFMNQEADP